jgi:nuclear distribution protein NudE
LTTSTSTGSVAKNKGVQMVSEMRARVRNLEQKIHTRVPRLRLASSTRQSLTSTPITPITGKSSPSSVASNGSTAKTSWESQRNSVQSRRTNDSPSSNNSRNSKKDAGDSSGWVLIMEDSPSPQKDKAKQLKERRRLSNGIAPTAFRPTASTAARATSPSLSTGSMNPLSVSTGVRRPQSRHSGGGPSAARPQTPTFLPVPSNSLSTSTIGMKRSTGPGAPNPYNQLKRSSLGKPAVPVPPLPTSIRERPTTMPPTGYTLNSQRSLSPIESKALPTLPNDLNSNVTIRPSSRMPTSASGTSLLSKSRIGRPSGGGISGRRSGGGETNNILDLTDLQPRSGASSTTN